MTTATVAAVRPVPGVFSPGATLATSRRVLHQLRNDHRTVALLLVVPCVLITLFKYVFQNSPGVFDRVGLPMLGIFPMLVMFLVTVVALAVLTFEAVQLVVDPRPVEPIEGSVLECARLRRAPAHTAQPRCTSPTMRRSRRRCRSRGLM